MPEPNLPTELIEIVVDIVAGGTEPERIQGLLNLSLCSKALVPRSQMHLFRSVILYHPSNRRGRIPRPRYLSLYRRTILILKSILRRPELASLVRELKYTLTSTLWASDTRLEDFSPAIKSMSNVQKFTLGYEDADAFPHHQQIQLDFASIASATWSSTILSVMRRPNLEHLTIHNIAGYPTNILFAGPCLVHLRLFYTSVKVSSEWEENHSVSDNTFKCRLKTLTCDSASLWAVIDRLLKPAEETSGDSSSNTTTLHAHFSQLEELDIHVNAHLNHSCSLVACTTSLRKVRMTVEAKFLEAVAAYPCPLQNMNAGSFQTLKYLDLRIINRLERPNMVIHQPYGCHWGKFLAQMVQLENFNIGVLFQGHLDVNPATFGAQWAQIADALDGQRQVQLFVQAKAVVEEAREDHSGKDAQAFIHNLQTYVYPSQLQWLCEPDTVGTVSRFSFKAEAIIETAACRCGRGSAHSEHH